MRGTGKLPPQQQQKQFSQFLDLGSGYRGKKRNTISTLLDDWRVFKNLKFTGSPPEDNSWSRIFFESLQANCLFFTATRTTALTVLRPSKESKRSNLELFVFKFFTIDPSSMVSKLMTVTWKETVVALPELTKGNQEFIHRWARVWGADMSRCTRGELSQEGHWKNFLTPRKAKKTKNIVLLADYKK